MIETEPMVFLVGEPTINLSEMHRYLKEVGGEEWLDRVWPATTLDGPPASELLTEFMGRLCYKSWKVGLNKNVTKIREDSGEYLLNVLRSGHGSVLEHAYFQFALHDVSRVLTAELNRHRAGVAISEQSLRYVRLDELRFRVPPVLRDETQDRLRSLVQFVEHEMGIMLQMEDMDNPDLDFAHKKTVTSALRRGVPLGLSTEEGWTANIRAIRHVMEMRSDPGAEEEIRLFARDLYELMSRKCPLLFQDKDIIYNGDGSDYRIEHQFRKV